MAKRRIISPDICRDPEMVRVPRDVRLFYVYLWMAADDAGNFDGDPFQVRMSTFPGDPDVTDQVIADWLKVLTNGKRQKGFIVPYCGGGDQADRVFYHIRRFHKHQNLRRPSAPEYPLAPGQEYVFAIRQGGTWGERKASRPPCEQCGADVERPAGFTCPYRYGTGNVPVTYGLKGSGKGKGKGKGRGRGMGKGKGLITGTDLGITSFEPRKASAIRGVLQRFLGGEMTLSAVSQELRNKGLDGKEVNQVAHLFKK